MSLDNHCFYKFKALNHKAVQNLDSPANLKNQQSNPQIKSHLSYSETRTKVLKGPGNNESNISVSAEPSRSLLNSKIN